MTPTSTAPRERDELTNLLSRLWRYSVISPDRLLHLSQLAHSVRSIPGDIVECGVAAGGSAAVLARSVRDSDRHLWLYDSFQGLPAPTAQDGPRALAFVGANRHPPGRAREALDLVGFPSTRTHVCEGWFADTLTRDGPAAIALLHIDADWYGSVLLCLQRLYDAVSIGGVIVLDDFGFWPGCRLALVDFCASRRLGPALQRFSDQAWWVKEGQT